MNIAHILARPLSRHAPPPAGGWLDDLPEAFGALDANGNVFIIGYRGEWYEPVRLTIRTRIHNWLISIGNKAKDSSK